ncbi:CoA-binding protein [uncultured Cytophaga sp.]|uniref:CoA-binding protein n=1 Tax=uncultured Cytophaga sp. TaxID=160238 RepID=UPI00262BFE73|nr:CoA-binding protein [uncultured Cytophaga sp.]
MKKTVILGATPEPTRYAYLAAERLQQHDHEFIPIGRKKGEVLGKAIINDRPILDNVDTVTLYINAQNQIDEYKYILSLKPKRVIFNPGTENPEFEEILQKNDIETVEGCTLVMLSVGTF